MNTRTKIQKNMLIGFGSQLMTIALGILVPRLVLTSYGSEINGLLNSVTQIYSYIALLEAGVGMATVQALYKTVGTGDRAATNAVLSATNRYYHRTGILYLIAILAFSFLYTVSIRTEIPTATVVLIIIFNGMANVISYFFQGKYFLLLQAEGKNYIQTSLNMATNVFKNIAKIVLMSMGADVLLVQALAMGISLIQMLYITWYINKRYKWIDLSVEPDFKSISQSKNVLIHQISGLIFNNTDAIVLSAVCGLKIVSIYSMYTMLFGMISTALSTVSSSVVFALGQMFHNNRKKFMKLYHCYETYYMSTVFALYSVANFFILPFMRLYTSGVNDVDYIDERLPLCFIATYLLSCGRSAPNQVIIFAGHFKLTQNRSILESIINLIVSIIAVRIYGIYGVLIGTVAALLYRTNDIIIYVNHRILYQSVWHTYKRWGCNMIIFICILFINSRIQLEMNTYFEIIKYCIPYTVITCLFYYIVASFTNRNEFKLIKQYLKTKTI